MPDAPAAWCAHGVVKYAHQYSQRGTGIIRHSPRNGFTAYSALFPGTTCFVDPVIRATRWRLANLTPASGRQNHTASSSAPARSSHAPLRPPHPAPRTWRSRVAPLCWDGTERSILLIFRFVKEKFDKSEFELDGQKRSDCGNRAPTRGAPTHHVQSVGRPSGSPCFDARIQPLHRGPRCSPRGLETD